MLRVARRLLLDDSLTVESRDVYPYEERAHEPAPESHWQTALPLLSPSPLPVSAGDRINLSFQAAHDSVDQLTPYSLKGELLPVNS